MSSERLRTQVLFENILGNNNYDTFKATKKSEIKNFVLTNSHVSLFDDTLREDALDFYYKGIISLTESFISVNNKSFSWATVKIYYSIFYFLRASLCLNGVGFARQARDLFYFANDEGGNFIEIKGPDHRAAIDLFVQLYRASDFLQSNTIGDANSYNWIMTQRENVNYKYRTFYEPDLSDTWQSISTSIDSDGLRYWINKYLLETIYTFLEDHAILAMPLRMLTLTYNRFQANQFIRPIRVEKIIRIRTLIQQNDFLSFIDDYIKEHEASTT